MPRFFTTDISGGKVRITGEDARHIVKSLRMRAGESVQICNLNGTDYECVILEASGELVVAEILEEMSGVSEPPVKISLYQALPKAGKLELIAQKAVELGVFEIIPVITSRCVSRWEKSDAEKKRERLQKIMTEAAKQSGRGIIPVTRPLCDFEEAVEGMKSANLAILCYEKADTPLKNILRPDPRSVSVMVGSEGGFSDDEAGYAAQNGISIASLGPRILRCETAALYALSALNFAYF